LIMDSVEKPAGRAKRGMRSGDVADVSLKKAGEGNRGRKFDSRGWRERPAVGGRKDWQARGVGWDGMVKTENEDGIGAATYDKRGHDG
jgi:hypothetical protein